MLFEEHRYSPNQRFAVGLSGGADSMALLIGLCEVTRDRGGAQGQITALHFNHGVNAEADQWQGQIAAVCARYEVELIAGCWEKSEEVVFTEGLSREARYQWFDQVVADDQVLLLGHHADDQVETVLLHLLQGRELGRIAGMPNRRSLVRGDARALCRPLLEFSKQSLVRYLEKLEERWIEDSANQDVTHDRNFLRQNVLPMLHERWPQVSDAVLGAAQNLGQLEIAWQAEVKNALCAVTLENAQRVFCLTAPIAAVDVVQFPAFKFAAVIRQWVHLAGKSAPSDAQIAQLYRGLLDWQAGNHSNRTGLEGCRLAWSDIEIRGYQNCLYLICCDKAPPSCDVAMVKQQLSLHLAVEWEEVAADGLSPDLLSHGDCYWRWRDGGEKVLLANRTHHSSLKKLWQASDIPPWERKRLPYLVLNGEIAWAWGVGVTQAAGEGIDKQRQILPRFLVALK